MRKARKTARLTLESLKAMKGALSAYMDKRGMRSAGEKAHEERLKRGMGCIKTTASKPLPKTQTH